MKYVWRRQKKSGMQSIACCFLLSNTNYNVVWWRLSFNEESTACNTTANPRGLLRQQCNISSDNDNECVWIYSNENGHYDTDTMFHMQEDPSALRTNDSFCSYKCTSSTMRRQKDCNANALKCQFLGKPHILETLYLGICTVWTNYSYCELNYDLLR